jgi:hypothetical protein
MTAANSDDTVAVSDTNYVDDSDVFAGKAPIPGDPQLMGQYIYNVLSERGSTTPH